MLILFSTKQRKMLAFSLLVFSSVVLSIYVEPPPHNRRLCKSVENWS